MTIACFALAGVGCVYTLAAAALVRRFAIAAVPNLMSSPGVTIVKPLHGAEVHLYDNLVSFCEQDYAGPVQILLGVHDQTDPAVAVVNRLLHDRPAALIRLIVTEGVSGGNPKIANLVGMEPHIEREVVVLSDSDIAVPRDYLTRTLAALSAPGVGLVTWLYRGAPRGGVYARLASMGIDYHFLPGVLVGLALRLARPCFGSTIALRRATLTAIGGFVAFHDRLADDYAIGNAVRAGGSRVAIASAVVTHTCSETSAWELWQHELRWATTVRSIDPSGYAGAVVMHPLPFALAAAALAGFGHVAIAVLVAVLACRLVLALQVDHTLAVPRKRWWLLPVRDLLSFTIYVCSFFAGTVTWRGQRFDVDRDGMLAPTRKPTS